MSSPSLFGAEDLLEGHAGETGELADGAAVMLAVGDDAVLVFEWSLEKFADVGERMVLLEVGQKAGLCDTQGSFGIVDDLGMRGGGIGLWQSGDDACEYLLVLDGTRADEI